MEQKDDDDDDVSFAKWMSSYWGHSWREEDKRGLRDRHRPQEASYRKASLPCSFPVLPSVTSSDHLPRRHSHEDQAFRSHTHVRNHRKHSGDGSGKEPLETKGRSHSKIQEFSESFEQQLCLRRSKRSASLGPESRKERNERERLRVETRPRKKAEDRRSSGKEHREAYVAPLFEKGSK
ncbi:leukemia NUP98 fusion partner 1 [Tupaia chinensis]|uniref:leukemia NUP98 fusion partner 1 n=1 Tax=Tupaia chinensis TaxID=246437 RepID=UPI0003C8E8E2|nr:leukemia NUP98 fusion partner 1 [Tupaia chinensis]